MGGLQQALSGYTPPSNAGNGGASTQPTQPQSAANATAAPDSSAPPATARQILMIAPSGEKAYVPQDQVASYEANGAKVGIRMTAPDGKEKAIVPFDQQDAYQKQGATWDLSPDNDAAKAFLTQRQQDASSRTNMNMTRAMSGRAMSTPADQAQFDAGKKAGTIAGASIIAGGTLGAALAAPGVITEEAATGLLDEFGEPITREIIKQGPSLLGKGFQAATQWATAHPTLVKEIIKVGGIAGALKVFGTMSKLEKEFGGK